MAHMKTTIEQLLTKPDTAHELLSECDALTCVELSSIIALLTAKPGEYGAVIDSLRSELADILTDYEHAKEMALIKEAKDDYDDYLDSLRED